jgi:nucleoporin NDC1
MTEPLKDGIKAPGDLFGKPPKPSSKSQWAAEEVGKFAKSHGQSPPGGLSPKARQILQSAESVILTPEQKAKIETQGLVGLSKGWITRFLETTAGAPFRQQYRRRIAAVVLGSPFGDVGIIVDAIDALTRFSVCSLTEDKYGNVQRDVPLIIRTLTSTVKKLQDFKKNLESHWTDVEKERVCPEVDAVLVALKTGLDELITAFGNYSQDLGLSQSEMRKAREAAAGLGP